MRESANPSTYRLDPLQRIATSLMASLVLLTFVGTNMQALLWQSSDWLVSTVLPAVVIDLTNNERVENARTQLTRNAVLDQAATAKAQHMVDNEYFAHFAPDGTTPWEFFKSAGYVYAHAGENLAIHFTDSSEVVEAWMLSPAHRKNIVDPKFREIGVGTARGTFNGYDTVYVVQLFGTPAGVAITPTPEPVITLEPETLLIEEVLVALEAVESTPALDPVVLAAEDAIVASEVVLPVLESKPVPVETSLVQEVTAPAPAVAEPALRTILTERGVIVETQLATSSGLAVATMVESSSTHAGATMASIITRPNLVLQILYGIVATLIVLSLLYALIAEARRLHYVQVAYSLALLLVMGGLWFLHTSLTSGAVIM